MIIHSPAPSDRDLNSEKSIDAAILACSEVIKNHRQLASLVLSLLLGCIAIFPLSVFFFYLSRGKDYAPDLESGRILAYIIFGAFVLIFSVMVALYRFHLSEIVRNERNKLGFHRIRIAANNISEGFLSEVRRSLTEGAFPPNEIPVKRKFESPIPGHPTSDVGSLLVEKLFESLELKLEKKKSPAEPSAK